MVAMVHATLGIPAPTREEQEGRAGRRSLTSGVGTGRRREGIEIKPEAPPNRHEARSSSAAVITMLQSLSFEFGRSSGSFGGRSLGFVCLRHSGSFGLSSARWVSCRIAPRSAAVALEACRPSPRSLLAGRIAPGSETSYHE
jgi:hypothetical protein